MEPPGPRGSHQTQRCLPEGTARCVSGGPARITWPLARGLQLAELGDLILRDDGHVPPEVRVLALLELHVHLKAEVQTVGEGMPGAGVAAAVPGAQQGRTWMSSSRSSMSATVRPLRKV